MSEELEKSLEIAIQKCVQSSANLENMKFKSVLEKLEKAFSFSKESLDAHKSLIKSIIKDETVKEYTKRKEAMMEEEEEEMGYNRDFMEGGNRLEIDNEKKKYHGAYIYYTNEQRPAVKNLNPDLSSNGISKKIGENWKNLSMEEKKRYMELSELEQNEKWKNDGENGFNRKGKKRMEKAIPKKVRSAYIFFCLKNRSRIQESNDGMSPVEVSKQLGLEWNSLTPAEKEPYRRLSEDDKERYLIDLKELGLTQEEIRRNNRNNTASAARAKSAYLYFCSLHREELKAQNPGLSSNEANWKLNALWNAMSEDKRFPYEVNAFDDKDRIKREVDKVKRFIKDPQMLIYNKAKRTKRARTPYTLFYKDKLNGIREGNENLAFGEISKRLSDMWKMLPEQEKQIYVEKSRCEQEEIYRNHASHAPHASEEKENDDREIFERQDDGYERYHQLRYTTLKEEKPGATNEEIDQQVSEEWQNMDNASRSEYYKITSKNDYPYQEKTIKLGDMSISMESSTIQGLMNKNLMNDTI